VSWSSKSKIQELTRGLAQQVEKRPVTRRLMTHPGVGPLTAVAFELVIGTPERFHCGKQIASYVGLVPSDESSGDRRRLGHISKQGNALLRYPLVEAAQVTVRAQPQWRSKFFPLAMRRGRKIAKVAMARKLALHLYWMWRNDLDFGQLQKLGLESVKFSARAKWGSSLSACLCALKVCLTLPTLLERGIYRQLRNLPRTHIVQSGVELNRDVQCRYTNSV
jgi:hypothetical protein